MGGFLRWFYELEEAGISLDFIGLDLGARCIKAEGGVKIPLPFTRKSLYVGGDAFLISIGIRSYFDKNEEKIRVGVSAGDGVGAAIGIVD